MCRKRPFATDGQRRRPARAAVCRIPCLILCLADVERVGQCRALERAMRILGSSRPAVLPIAQSTCYWRHVQASRRDSSSVVRVCPPWGAPTFESSHAAAGAVCADGLTDFPPRPGTLTGPHPSDSSAAKLKVKSLCEELQLAARYSAVRTPASLNRTRMTSDGKASDQGNVP